MNQRLAIISLASIIGYVAAMEVPINPSLLPSMHRADILHRLDLFYGRNSLERSIYLQRLAEECDDCSNLLWPVIKISSFPEDALRKIVAKTTDISIVIDVLRYTMSLRGFDLAYIIWLKYPDEIHWTGVSCKRIEGFLTYARERYDRETREKMFTLWIGLNIEGSSLDGFPSEVLIEHIFPPLSKRY